jgi:hypothetical protein
MLLLLLVAAATLTVVHPPGAQDTSRMCLTRAIVSGHLWSDRCLRGNLDRAQFAGHLYSDKAPGLSVLAVPAAELVQLPAPARWHGSGDLRLWLVRLSTGGLAILACALLIGRIAEGLEPGWGGAALVTFAAGTLMSSLAVDNFDAVPAAALGFGAFLLAWRGKSALAGLLAGIGIVVEYQVLLVALPLGGYIALAGGRRFLRYVLGAVPGLALLGAYDWVAFGSPWHLSYRYVAPRFASQQAGGFFGIHAPRWHAIRIVLLGTRGLLVNAPVLAAATIGLALLWRRGLRAEAGLCGLVAMLFLALEFGYFDPFGGISPGPRFFVPALPFVAVGLAPAFAARRTATAALAVASVISSTAVLLSWPSAVDAAHVYYETVWRELAAVVAHGRDADLILWVQKDALDWLGIGRLGSAAFVFVVALGALAIALHDGWSAKTLARAGSDPQG